MSVFHNMETYHLNHYLDSPSVLLSPSSVSSMNTDGNIHLYGSTMSSPTSENVSPLSNSMSPVSSSDSNSAYNLQQLQISSNANEDFVSMNTKMNEPFLEITEQPIDKFRFRYITEMKGTHGMITGQHSKKTFPSIRLRNFNGEALIRCSLFQILKTGHGIAFPHSHSLVIRCDNENKKDPHEAMVSQLNLYKATFHGMGIIHTARGFIEVELYEKLCARAEFEYGRKLTKHEQDTLRSKAKKHSTDMNLNQVSLCFEAYERVNGKWMRLCESVHSTPINNLKSALTGDLKISRMSTVVGSAAGNEDLFIFVGKVGKKNIKVRFFEQDDDKVIWEAWGKFTEADVHYQCAIALKTPPYRKTNIDGSVKVNIQLYRPGDGAMSEAVEFRYKSCCHSSNTNRKRPRATSMYDPDVPVVATENAFVCNPADCYVPQTDNIIDISSDIEQMFPDLFNNNQNELALNADDFSSLMCMLDEHAEFDKLAKDSVSCDEEPILFTREEKWISQFLEKVDPLLKYTIGTKQSEISRKFFEYIFQKAYFSGDSIIHICVKSEDLKMMDRLWEILHKFQLYDLLNVQNHNRETCAHLASAINKPKILMALIMYGSDVNVVDVDGNTALHIAIQEKNDECAAMILSIDSDKWGEKINIDLNIANYNGYTVLHLAAMCNCVNVVKMLDRKATQIKNPIFEDVEGKHGNNALHIAIEWEAREVAEYLLQNKCINPAQKNKSGHLALYLARVAKANELVELMQRYSPIDDENFMFDADDVSSQVSFESKEIDQMTEPTKLTANTKILVDSDKLERKSEGGKFDDCCLTELSDIFNKNGKWKSIATILGYEGFVAKWQKLRNPTKVLLMYAESLKVPKETLADIFRDNENEEASQI